jgi:hypothetical protein
MLALPGAVSAALVNTAELDNGHCGQNLQIGSNKTASSTATPSFLLAGNGGLSSYSIKIDGVLIGTFDSDGWAKVCIRTTLPLSEGAHTLTGNELRPNSSNTVTPFNFTVQTRAPAVPSTPMMASFSDSGVKGDYITKYRNVALNGTADPSISIQLYSGAVGVGGALASSTGVWNATTSTLADGTYTIRALALSASGVKSALSPGITITIDGTPPGAPPAPTLSPSSDTMPQGDNHTTILNPIVRGTGAAGMWKVTVFVDGAQVGTATPDAGGAWQYTLPTQTTGTHLVSAKLTDVADNMGTASGNLSLTIGTGSPTPTPTPTATPTPTPTPTPTVPGAPTAVGATAGNAQVSLNWQAPVSNGGSSITGYIVTSSPGSQSCSTASALTCVVGSLANGTMYSLTVRAYNPMGVGPASNAVSAMPGLAPSVPQTVVVYPNKAAGVRLTWLAPSSIGSGPVLGYRIYRSTASGAETYLATVGTVLAFTDKTVQNGTTYYYQLAAYSAYGESPRTAEKIASRGTAPSAPLNVTAAKRLYGGVKLTWSPPASNGGASITRYRIYRSKVSGNETFLISVGNVTKYVDKATKKGVRYYYWVRAVNVLGTGPRSSEVSAKSG